MSHKASYWLAALDASAVTSGGFRVLFHLCDHHNDERDPERACFPSQSTLRAKTGLSNGGLNKILATLESDGLIWRKTSTKEGSKERRTFYILGCDFTAPTNQTPLSGVSTNSTAVELEGEQTPLSDVSNSTFGANKLHPSGEEPVKEPVKEPLRADFENFLSQHPMPVRNKKTERLFAALIEGGVPSSQLISSAKNYAKAVASFSNASMIQSADNFLHPEWGKWSAYAPSHNEPTQEQRDRSAILATVKMIKSGNPALCSHISAHRARSLVAREFVTIEECQKVGVLK